MEKQGAHILILSSWYPTNDNPFLGNFVERQVALLASKYNVSIVQCIEDSSVKNLETKKVESESITQITIRYPKKVFKISKKLTQRKALSTGLNLLSKVDILIGNILLPNGWQFVAAKKQLNCPLLYIEHGSYFGKNSSYKWRAIDKLILNKVNEVADEIIAVSDFLKTDLQTRYPSRDIKVIGNHVDLNLFNKKEESPTDKISFLHVSTLDKKTKNADGIIDACKHLKEIVRDFSLKIITDEDYSDLQKRVKSLGLENNVTFLGPLDWNELPPHYHDSSAFILFSNYESFSIVLAEAWATGTPVISTPVGIANKMSEDIGIQVEVNNATELAEAMRTIVEGKQFDTELIRKHAKQYGAEAILSKWTQLIDKHLG